MVYKEREEYIPHEDYETGALIGKELRNRIVHMAAPAKGLYAMVTFGIFGIMMKCFSVMDHPPLEVPKGLQVAVLNNWIGDEMLFRQLAFYLHELERGSGSIGWHGSIYRELEECRIYDEEELLRVIFDTLSHVKVYSSENCIDVYIAAAVQFILSIGEYGGTGLSSIAVMPIEVMQLLKQLADIKDGYICYGATNESVVLLPYVVPKRNNAAIFSYDKSNYTTAFVMLQIMSRYNGTNKLMIFSHPYVPADSSEIIGKCHRAFAFPSLYRQLIPNAFESIASDELRKCIAWWPEYPNSNQWLYARHITASLNEQGIGYVFMPLGMLSRTGNEMEIRRRFIEEDLIDTVIEFPGGTFMKSNASVALVILKRGRETKTVYMINLAGKKGKNYITVDTRFHSVNFTGLNKIEKMIRDCTIIEGLSNVVTGEEIAENAYSLSPSAYTIPKIEINVERLDGLIQQMEVLQSEYVKISDKYDSAISGFQEMKKSWDNDR